MPWKSAFSLGEVVTAAKLNAMLDDDKAWKGNVNAGGFYLTNLAGVIVGGVQIDFNNLGGGGVVGVTSSENTPNSLALRDDAGSFAAEVITAVHFVGDGASITGVPWASIIGRPTVVSAFTNDAGYLTSASSLAWAKVTGAPAFLTTVSIPTNVSAFTNDAGYLTAASSLAWAKVTGAPATMPPTAHTHVWADLTNPPTAVSAFSNDAGYLTSASSLAWVRITGAPAFLTTASIPTNVSAFANDAGYLSSSGSYNNPAWLTALAWSKITGAPTTGTPSPHTHAWADITDRPTVVSAFANDAGYLTAASSLAWGKLTGAPAFVTAASIPANVSAFTNDSGYLTAASNLAWGKLTGVPATFTPVAHVHAASDVTSGAFGIGLIPTGTSGSTVALGNHVHSGVYEPADATILRSSGSYSDPAWLTISKAKVGLGSVENTALSTWAGSANITAIGTLASGSVPWARLTSVPASFAPSAHTHAAADVTSGAFAIGLIPTGTTSVTVALGNHAHSGVYEPVDATILRSGGSYSNPVWLTALAWSKITSAPSTFAPAAHAASHAGGAADAITSLGAMTFSGAILGQHSSHTSVSPTAYYSYAGISFLTDPNFESTLAYGYDTGTNPIFQVAAKPYNASGPGVAWDPSTTIRLTVLGNGNVGIGSAAPAVKLDVAGAILLSATVASAPVSGIAHVANYGMCLTPAPGGALADFAILNPAQSAVVFGVTSNSYATLNANLTIYGTAAGVPLDLRGTSSAGDAAGYTAYLTGSRYGQNFSLLGFGSSHSSRPSTLQLSVFNTDQNLALIADDVGAVYSGTSVKGIFIKAGGNVGIGTSSPGSPLQLSSDMAAYGQFKIKRAATSGEASIGFYSAPNLGDTSAWVLGSGPWGNTDDFVIGQNGARVIVKNSTGNVGIGTNNPSAKLSAGLGSAANDGFNILYAPDGTQIAKFFANTDTGQVTIGGTAANYFPTFYANGSEAMRIDIHGKAAIGTTTSRGHRLQVAMDSAAVSSQPFGDWQGNGQLAVMGGTNQDKRLAMGVDTTLATMVGVIQALEAGVSVRSLALNPSGGNVGIGTTSPGQRLTVIGDASDPSLNWNSVALARFAPAGGSQLTVSAIAADPYGIALQVKNTTYDGYPYALLLNPLGGNVAIGQAATQFRLTVAGVTWVHGAYNDSVNGAGDITGGGTEWTIRTGNTVHSFNVDLWDTGTSWYRNVLSFLPVGGYLIHCAPPSAVSDSALANSQMSVWYDEGSSLS